jgi:hypothetical protein
VTYYTIQIEEEEENLFLQFVNAVKDDEDAQEELAILRKWISKIGDEIGARKNYFRGEGYGKGGASALPPPARYLNLDCSLRLYCMHINEHIVILFGGAQKTAQRAQDCPQVRPHFLLANKLSAAIDEAIRFREIWLSEDDRQLLFDEDFELEI